jgi:hypothetical protein
MASAQMQRTLLHLPCLCIQRIEPVSCKNMDLIGPEFRDLSILKETAGPIAH